MTFYPQKIQLCRL